MCLRTFSDYRPPSFIESKARLERLLCEVMEESLSEESWLLLLPRPARLTSVFSIVLICWTDEALVSAVRPLLAHELCHSLLALSEKASSARP